MGELSYTVGGDNNLVSFKSAARVPITSLKAHFKPKQDLHGYSKPWPAGGGKNLFDVSTLTTGTLDGYGRYGSNENRTISPYIYLSSGTYTVSRKEAITWWKAHLYDMEKTPYEQQLFNNASGLSFTFTVENDCYFRISFDYIEAGDGEVQLEKGSTATSYEPYENICPIEGWNNCNAYVASKNIGHIIGYSAGSMNSPKAVKLKTGNYGNSINTTTYSLPDTSVTITQTQWPSTSNIYSYTNGYFCVAFDNLIFGQKYDFSFKITNITNNPLGASLNNIRIGSPKALHYGSPQIIDNNTLLFKNVTWQQYTASTEGLTRCTLDIYYCGMSFTLSEMMVTAANTSDGIFEPYHVEVIPITFPITGKNLCNSASGNDLYFTGGIGYGNYTIENGSMTTSGGVLMGFKTPCIPNTTYTFSFTSTYTGNNLAVRVYENIDEPMVFPTQASGTLLVNEWHVSSATFTTGETTNWITVGMYIDPTQGANGITMSNFMLNFGSTAETYKPYSADNTYYSGYVNLATGEVVAEYGIVTLTGNENVTWSVWSASTIYTGNTIFPRKPNNSENILIEGWCNYTRQNNGKLTNIAYPSVGSYGLEFNNVISYWGLKEATAQALKAKLQEFYNSGKPLQIVYKLNTPQVIPINPTELKTFLNVNNIWTNTNDITEASYAIHDTAPIRAVKHRITANEPHVETIDSSLAHFETDMIAPLKECKVHFAPKQDTNGYGKVWVGGCGKNLFNINAPFQNPDNTIFTATNTKRVFTPYTYCVGITGNNFFEPNNVESYSIENNTLTVTPVSMMYGVGYAIPVQSSTTYMVSFTGTNWRFELGFYESDGTFINFIYGSKTEPFETPANCTMMTIVFNSYPAGSTATYTNIQIEKASAATSYEPYENICPIEGTTNIEVYKTGKNLFDINTMVGRPGVTVEGNTFIGAANNIRYYHDNHPEYTSLFIPAGTTFVVHCMAYTEANSSTSGAGLNPYFKYEDETDAPRPWYTSNSSITPTFYSGTITAQKNITKFYWSWYNYSSNIWHISDFQIEILSMPTEYEPYNGETIPITFPLTIGKNKFNIDVEFANPDVTANTAASKRIFKPYTYCLGGSYSNYFTPEAIDSYSIENGVISVKRKSGYSVYGVSYAIPLVGGTTYHFSCNATYGYVHTAFYDNEGNYLTGSYLNVSDFTFTVPNTSTISVFNFIAEDATNVATYSNIQIELGNTATSYEPYTAIGGGYIDLKEGKLIQTHKCITLNGSENWDYYRENQPIHFHLTIPDKKIGLGKSICSHFPNVKNEYFWDYLTYAQYGDHGNLDRIYVNAPYKMPGLVTEWKAYLAEHPMQLCYELATPIEYTLTPTQLKTLRGQNNIWSDANGPIELKYWTH